MIPSALYPLSIAQYPDITPPTVEVSAQYPGANAQVVADTVASPIAVALKSSEESLVVPWSAILHDLNGGTWVYENVSPQVYARRRVEVRLVMDGLAILTRGLAPGVKVVSVGAAEIFGTEFGTGK